MTLADDGMQVLTKTDFIFLLFLFRFFFVSFEPSIVSPSRRIRGSFLREIGANLSWPAFVFLFFFCFLENV